jgi:hypothetical protein
MSLALLTEEFCNGIPQSALPCPYLAKRQNQSKIGWLSDEV